MVERNLKRLEPFCFKDEGGIAYRKLLDGEMTLDQYRQIKRGVIGRWYRESIDF